MQSDVVFLFSSEMEPPKRYFQGYFFHGADYVFGSAGFDQFQRARQPNRAQREDGCYVLVDRQPDGSYRFSTDYCGYKKLFYFWDAGHWAVSNSLFQLSQHLARRGNRLLPDYAQVAAMPAEGTFYPSGRGSFFAQMSTFQTIVKGVLLVPADCSLYIGRQGLRLEKSVRSVPIRGYADQLGHFLHIWVSRFLSVLANPSVRLSCDLTGGLDSRTVFALLIAATKSFTSNDLVNPQIRSADGRAARRDHRVATTICESLGLTLNGRLGKKPRHLTGELSYRRWRDLCLGVYHPISFPACYPEGGIIQFGGGGGENHRAFYDRLARGHSTEEFIVRRARNLGKRHRGRPDFELQLRDTLASIMDGAPAQSEARVIHYRNFRNRFHFGREPQYAVTFQPLASKLLESAMAVAGSDRFQRCQVYYDIINSMAPSLLDLKFDKRHKQADSRRRANLAPVVIAPPVTGSCFIGIAGSSTEDRHPEGEGDGGPLVLLNSEYRRAAKGFAKRVLGHRYVSSATAGLDHALEKGGFSGPIASKRVAVVLACCLFDP